MPVIPGRGKSSVSIGQLTCTACEKMIVDEDTCVAHCVPDTTKISSNACYPDDATECTGETQGLYFGFPDAKYINNVLDITGHAVVLDTEHSQNRKFNCMDCGERGVNTELSFPPYITICN